MWQLALAAEQSSDEDKDTPAACPVPSKGLRKPRQSAVKLGVATKNSFEGLEVNDDSTSDHKDKDFRGRKEGSDSSETSSAASDSDIEEIAAGHKIMDPEAANTWLVELEKAMNKLADAFNRQVQCAQVCSCPSGSVFIDPSKLSGIPVQPRGI